MRVLFAFILSLLVLVDVKAQIINFIPDDRPIYILGSCVVPPIKCLVDSSAKPMDTVRFTAPRGGMYVYDSVFSRYIHQLKSVNSSSKI